MSISEKSKLSLDETEKIELIRVKDIIPNKEQSTGIRDEEAFERLKQNIIAHGQQQPIKVRKEKNKFELVIGEHRWMVAKQRGLERIKAIVMDVDANEASEIALSDNLCRTGYNPTQMEDMVHKRFKSGKYNNNISELGRRIGLTDVWTGRLIKGKEYRAELKEHLRDSKLNLDDIPTNTMLETKPLLNGNKTNINDAIDLLKLVKKKDIKAGDVKTIVKDLLKWENDEVTNAILREGASYYEIKVGMKGKIKDNEIKDKKVVIPIINPDFIHHLYRIVEGKLQPFIADIDTIKQKKHCIRHCKVITTLLAEMLNKEGQITDEQYKMLKEEILGVHINPHCYIGESIDSLGTFYDTETTEEETEE